MASGLLPLEVFQVRSGTLWPKKTQYLNDSINFKSKCLWFFQQKVQESHQQRLSAHWSNSGVHRHHPHLGSTGQPRHPSMAHRVRGGHGLGGCWHHRSAGVPCGPQETVSGWLYCITFICVDVITELSSDFLFQQKGRRRRSGGGGGGRRDQTSEDDGERRSRRRRSQPVVHRRRALHADVKHFKNTSCEWWAALRGLLSDCYTESAK